MKEKEEEEEREVEIPKSNVRNTTRAVARVKRCPVETQRLRGRAAGRGGRNPRERIFGTLAQFVGCRKSEISPRSAE